MYWDLGLDMRHAKMGIGLCGLELLSARRRSLCPLILRYSFFFSSFLSSPPHFLRFASCLVLCCFSLPGVPFSCFFLFRTSDSRYLLYTATAATAIIYPFTMRGEYLNESSQPPSLFCVNVSSGAALLATCFAGCEFSVWLV